MESLREGTLWDTSDVEGVQFIDDPLAILDEGPRLPETPSVLRPVTGVEIFDEVDASRLHMVVECLEGGDEMPIDVTPVIDEDIDRGDPPSDLGQGGGIVLTPDDDLDILEVGLHKLTTGIDVQTIDPTLPPEVVVPHLQRAPLTDPYLEDHRILPDEPLEVPVVDLEVVVPFVDEVGFGNLEEEFLEFIHG